MGNKKKVENDVISWSSEHFYMVLYIFCSVLSSNSSSKSSVVQTKSASHEGCLAMHLSGTDAGHVWMWYFDGLVGHGLIRKQIQGGIDFWTGFPAKIPRSNRNLNGFWTKGAAKFLECGPFSKRWEETALTNALKARRKLSSIYICWFAFESCIKSSLHMLFPLLPNPVLWARANKKLGTHQGRRCCNRVYFCQLCQDPSAKILLPLWVSCGLRVWSRNSISLGQWIWIWWISLLSMLRIPSSTGETNECNSQVNQNQTM